MDQVADLPSYHNLSDDPGRSIYLFDQNLGSPAPRGDLANFITSKMAWLDAATISILFLFNNCSLNSKRGRNLNDAVGTLRSLIGKKNAHLLGPKNFLAVYTRPDTRISKVYLDKALDSRCQVLTETLELLSKERGEHQEEQKSHEVAEGAETKLKEV